MQTEGQRQQRVNKRERGAVGWGEVMHLRHAMNRIIILLYFVLLYQLYIYVVLLLIHIYISFYNISLFYHI